jgi:soluble lytic murein transglycosylase-like protein
MGAAVVLALTVLCCGPSGVPPAITVTVLEPEPTPVVPTVRSVSELLEQAARRYRVDPVRMRRIIRCESGFNPNAVSRGGHKGLAQFADRTYAWAGREAGYGGWSVFDPEANLMAAAWLMSQPGGFAHWSCR